MKKNREKTIEILSRILADAKDLIIPRDKVIRVINDLECAVNLAEESRDSEVLELIQTELVKELSQLESVYQNFYTQENVGIFRELNQAVESTMNRVSLLNENPVTHVSADTYANMGDFLLVRCLRKTIERKTPGKIGWIDVDVRKKVNDGFVSMCNQTNAVILGGGGLFLKDTNQNDVSNWQWNCTTEDIRNIRVPIYVLGIGYNRFRGQEDFEPCFTESVNTLVEQSAFFGVRNHGSVNAIRGYLREELREKVRFHPCATTVISKLYQLPSKQKQERVIAVNWASDRMAMRYQGKHYEVMKSIANVLKSFTPAYRIKCYMHCQMDELICKVLEAEQIPYEKVYMNRELTEEELLERYTEPDLVLAIRGHAQMIPFGCKTPVVSLISHDKLKWFLDDIEHPEWGVEVLDDHFEEKLLEKCNYMLDNRDKIRKEIEAAQEIFWNVIQENLKEVIL